MMLAGASSNGSFSGLGVQVADRKFMTMTYGGSTCNRKLGNVIDFGDTTTYSIRNTLVHLLRSGKMNIA